MQVWNVLVHVSDRGFDARTKARRSATETAAGSVCWGSSITPAAIWLATTALATTGLVAMVIVSLASRVPSLQVLGSRCLPSLLTLLTPPPLHTQKSSSPSSSSSRPDSTACFLSAVSRSSDRVQRDSRQPLYSSLYTPIFMFCTFNLLPTLKI